MAFFEYSQNNSGGGFDLDENVSYTVYVEADSAEEANKKAEEIGIYFDGIDKGLDCECCGDRWYPAYGEGTELPEMYGVPLDDIKEKPLFKVSAIIHYKDGTKKYWTYGEEK